MPLWKPTEEDSCNRIGTSAFQRSKRSQIIGQWHTTSVTALPNKIRADSHGVIDFDTMVWFNYVFIKALMFQDPEFLRQTDDYEALDRAARTLRREVRDLEDENRYNSKSKSY